MTVKKFLSSLVIIFICSTLVSVPPGFAKADLDTCSRLLESEVKPVWKSAALALDHFETISKIRISEFFPEVEASQKQSGSSVVVAKVTPELTQRFRNYFDLYVRYQGQYGYQFPKAKFLKWLESRYGSKYPPLDPVVIEHVYKVGNFTLKLFVDEFVSQFNKETRKEPYKIWTYMGMTSEKPVFVFFRKVTNKFFKLISVFVLSGLLLKTFPDMWGGYTYNLFAPPQQIAVQKGNQHFSKAVQFELKIFRQLSTATENLEEKKKLAQELKVVNDHLHNYDFQDMTPQQARETWFAFEDRYLAVYQRFGKTLIGNYISGRSIYRDNVLMMPVNFASEFSTFNIQYITNQALMESLEREIKSQEAPPTKEQINRIKFYREGMDQASKAYAAGLVAYKIHRFIYSEVSRTATTAEQKELDRLVMEAFNRASEYMGFEQLVRNFTDEMQKAIEILDPSLPNKEKLLVPYESTKTSGQSSSQATGQKSTQPPAQKRN